MGGSTGPGTTDQDEAVPEAALGAEAAAPPAAPEAAAGGLSGRDLDTALSSANEADLAEQSLEVPYDDDEL